MGTEMRGGKWGQVLRTPSRSVINGVGSELQLTLPAAFSEGVGVTTFNPETETSVPGCGFPAFARSGSGPAALGLPVAPLRRLLGRPHGRGCPPAHLGPRRRGAATSCPLLAGQNGCDICPSPINTTRSQAHLTCVRWPKGTLEVLRRLVRTTTQRVLVTDGSREPCHRLRGSRGTWLVNREPQRPAAEFTVNRAARLLPRGTS